MWQCRLQGWSLASDTTEAELPPSEGASDNFNTNRTNFFVTPK